MKVLKLLILLLVLSFSASAQSDCPCCTVEYRSFDFWVGDWTVYDTNGQVVGYNHVEKLESGCLISENWKGVRGSSGRSYNYFNRQDSTWNQVWVDSRGGNLILKGNGKPGVMTLRNSVTERNGQLVYDQITWELNQDGSVLQRWDVMSPGQVRMRTIFKGIYRKK